MNELVQLLETSIEITESLMTERFESFTSSFVYHKSEHTWRETHCPELMAHVDSLYDQIATIESGEG